MRTCTCVAAALLLVAACTVDRSGLARVDSGPVDAAIDARENDAEADAGVDSGPIDGARPDAAGDAGWDAGVDAGVDAGGCVGCSDWGCELGVCVEPEVPNLTDQAWLTEGGMDFVLAADGTFNTSDGAIRQGGSDIRGSGTGVVDGIRFETRAQPGGPGFGVWVFESLTISEGATLRGMGSRALMIVVRTTINIDGLIDVSGTGTSAGPGGLGGTSSGAGSDGRRTGGCSTGSADPGGGGAGHGGAGARGGNGMCGTGGAAGSVYGGSQEPLLGGSVGGQGISASTGGRGGGGGGAIELVAGTRIDIGASGGVNAGAGGGRLSSDDGGGGGGSGGGIVLVAPAVSGSGTVAANGGGGGSRNTSGGGGDLSTGRASGGTGSGSAGDGGRGGAGTSLDGTSGSAGSDLGGGGGGGVGRIRVISLDATVGAGLTFSPSVSPVFGVEMVVPRSR